MATELVKRDLIKETNLVPGSFTGNYTTVNRPVLNSTHLEKLSTAAVSFTEELQKTMKQNPVALRAALTQPVKVQNVPNNIPLLGSVMPRIGIEGVILSLRPILYYCQFNKKMSPAPRFM